MIVCAEEVCESKGRLLSSGFYLPDFKDKDYTQTIEPRYLQVLKGVKNSKGRQMFSDNQLRYIGATLDSNELGVLMRRPEDSLIIAMIKQMSHESSESYMKVCTASKWRLDYLKHSETWAVDEFKLLEGRLGRRPTDMEVLKDMKMNGNSARHRVFYALKWPERMIWPDGRKKGLKLRLQEAL